jgi:hypothetical protein
MPNVTIGRGAIIAAGSVVTTSIPAGSLAAGVPAKVIRAAALTELTATGRAERLQEIVSSFHVTRTSDGADVRNHPGLHANAVRIAIDDHYGLSSGGLLLRLSDNIGEEDRKALLARGISIIDLTCLTAWIIGKSSYVDDFVEHLRGYGIRLSVERVSPESRPAW